MCHDPYVGYPERYFRVALEIRRMDVLFVGSSVCDFGAGYCV